MELRKKVSDLLLIDGIEFHLDGYQFIIDAVEMVNKDRSKIYLLNKVVYNDIGDRYGKSGKCVERSIRFAIQRSGLNLSNSKYIKLLLIQLDRS